MQKKKTKKQKKSIKDFRNRDFSEYCEYVVAFKLQELGWKVFQPLVDRYIDIIAFKKKGKDELLVRTIQVKSSRAESAKGEDPESYGLTHKPKDLLHDSRHFFVWVFIDHNNKTHFFILSLRDFIDVRWILLPPSQRRKNPSLLMRGEWRWGTDRMHPYHWVDHKRARYKKALKTWKKPKKIKEPSWTLENAVLDLYYNDWKKLEKLTEKRDVMKFILSQEIDKNWAGVDKKILKKWKKNNKIALSKLKKYPVTFRSSLRLDDLLAGEEE